MRSFLRLRSSTASSGVPNPVPRRAFTSMSTRVSPSSATMSICPRRLRQSRARMWKPCSFRYDSAATSPACPTRSLSGRAGGSCSGVRDPRLRSAVALRRCDGTLGVIRLRSHLGRVCVRDLRLVGHVEQLVRLDLDFGRRIGFGAKQRHLRATDGLTPLPNPSVAADLLAQVEELCPAHLAVAKHLDPVDARSMHQEGALDADTMGDAANCETRRQPDLALERDDHALEHLDALAGSLNDLDVHAHGVA